MNFTDLVFDLMQRAFKQGLKDQGIPINPLKRTPDQQALANMVQWSVTSSVLLTANNLSQGVFDDA